MSFDEGRIEPEVGAVIQINPGENDFAETQNEGEKNHANYRGAVVGKR